MEHPLDNPAWNALNSGNKNLSKGTERVKYFPDDVSPFVGMAKYGAYEFDLLYDLLPLQRRVAFFVLKEMVIPNQWVVMDHIPVLQMIYQQSTPPGAASEEIILLHEKDVPEMISLTKLMHPGPFFPRTIEFGNYEGIFNEGELVAMTGQRLHANQYIEISAVCTHPKHHGKGYASHLIQSQIRRIKSASAVPFLHVKEDNTEAIHLYKTLGFEVRKQMDIYAIEKKG